MVTPLQDRDRLLFVECLEQIPGLRDVPSDIRLAMMQDMADETRYHVRAGFRDQDKVLWFMRRDASRDYGALVVPSVIDATAKYIVTALFTRIFANAQQGS